MDPQYNHSIALEIKFTRTKALLALVLLFLCWHPGYLGSETLTLTTYYPAPYGGYVTILTTSNAILARDGGGVGIGPGGAPAGGVKLDVRGGGIEMDAGQTLHSRGRMHIDGEEILYLLNNNGVVVSKAWGGTGNLSVEGFLYGVCTRVYYPATGWSNACANGAQLVGAMGDGANAVSHKVDKAGGGTVTFTEGESWSGTMTCCKFF